MSWDPAQYLKFEEPRLRPAADLLARVPLAQPHRVCDLGCGAGNVTRLLAQRWPSARITGVDESAEMLAKASSELPGVEWVRQSVAQWRPAEPADLIYSNAALHWLPDHEALFPALVGCLAPNGVLAVQMPRNFAAPSHTLIAQTAAESPWRESLAGLVVRPPVAEPAFYYGLLEGLAESVDIWETEYLQVLRGADPVKEWTKGSWLRQFLDALPEGQRQPFEDEYARKLRSAYPRRADGTTLFPFRRLFIVARKG